jgi:hypothetical protein
MNDGKKEHSQQQDSEYEAMRVARKTTAHENEWLGKFEALLGEDVAADDASDNSSAKKS